MVSPSWLHHIAVGARDPERLAEFYRAELGSRELRRNYYTEGGLRSVWLGLGQTVLMLEHTREPSRRVEGVGSGPFLLAFGVCAEELPRREAELRERGIVIEGRSEHSLYFRDPEGNRVALSAYPTDDLGLR